MLSLQNITYLHPDREILFEELSLTINKQDKIALIGNNGTGKSTLLKILAGVLQPAKGIIRSDVKPYYIPQHFGQYNDQTIAQALHIDAKIAALKAILEGEVMEANMAALDDDWAIEERCEEAFSYWKLTGLDLSQEMNSLSGGQKTKVFLAGITIHNPQIVLLDEPTNHLDLSGRELLYQYVLSTQSTLVIVSHDRTLLNLLNTFYELSTKGLSVYGGNYDFYAAQKAIEANASAEDLKSREKALRKAKEVEREIIERQQKLDARGRKKQEKAGIPTIALNTLRNSAEKSTARTKDVHAEKIGTIADEVNQLRKAMPDKDKMKIGFDGSILHNGKLLVSGKGINYRYGLAEVWNPALNFEIHSGDRIAIKGDNGSGKTTLIKIILDELKPSGGTMLRNNFKAVYIDQDYSLLQQSLSVYEQAQQFNTAYLQEYEIKSRLTHFLFTKEDWEKPCSALSGGERMRLLLCCLTIDHHAPDLIVFDEPTNNLDIQNIEILTEAIKEYRGTVLVVSHDVRFLEEIDIEKVIQLN